MKPRLIVEQKLTAFVNRYEIYAVTDDGVKGDMIAFAQQKRLAFKEKVEFFADPAKEKLLFTFRAEKVMDVHGKYFVEDTKGNVLGVFKKEFAKSLINSTWNILDADDRPLLKISESSQFLAAARRFAGWIPFIGELLEIVTTLFRYHFVFVTQDDNRVGTYTKTTLFFDRYRLDMTNDIFDSQDWRVFAAFAVALDALQSR